MKINMIEVLHSEGKTYTPHKNGKWHVTINGVIFLVLFLLWPFFCVRYLYLLHFCVKNQVIWITSSDHIPVWNFTAAVFFMYISDLCDTPSRFSLKRDQNAVIFMSVCLDMFCQYYYYCC